MLILETNNRLAHNSPWKIFQLYQGPFSYYITATACVQLPTYVVPTSVNGFLPHPSHKSSGLQT